MIEKLNLPNKLTILRIILTPILIFLMLIRYGNIEKGVSFSSVLLYLLILVLFIFISLTDFLDGYIARRENLVTNLGKLLDPIADKIFVFSILIVLVRFNLVSIWLVLLLLAREFVVVAVRALVIENGGEVIAASIWGKLKTVFQIVAISLIIIFPFNKIINSIILLPSVCFSTISMIDYIKLTIKYIWEKE